MEIRKFLFKLPLGLSLSRLKCVLNFNDVFAESRKMSIKSRLKNIIQNRGHKTKNVFFEKTFHLINLFLKHSLVLESWILLEEV